MTKEENRLLEKLNSGELDGIVGNIFTTDGGSDVWMSIVEGVPVRYKQGPGGKFFNGEENERYEGVLHTLMSWNTDELKLSFLQNYGWLMADPDVKEYSAKFKPK